MVLEIDARMTGMVMASWTCLTIVRERPIPTSSIPIQMVLETCVLGTEIEMESTTDWIRAQTFIFFSDVTLREVLGRKSFHQSLERSHARLGRDTA